MTGSRAVSRTRSSTRSSRGCPRTGTGRWSRSMSPPGRGRRSCCRRRWRGIDPGRQLITVTRKGTRELQELPASTDAFVWLRLYQVEMAGADPRGRHAAVVVDAAPPGPAADLSRGAPHVRAGERQRQARTATLHSLRHTAAYRMAEDPALPLTDVQLVLGHAQLTTTQIYLTPRKEDVIRRVLAHHAEQTRQAARARAGCRRPATGPRRWTCCSGRAHRDRRPARPSCARHRGAAGPRRHAARSAFPARRPRAADWPATRQAARRPLGPADQRAVRRSDNAGAQPGTAYAG